MTPAVITRRLESYTCFRAQHGYELLSFLSEKLTGLITVIQNDICITCILNKISGLLVCFVLYEKALKGVRYI